jgi:hypothetical protein
MRFPSLPLDSNTCMEGFLTLSKMDILWFFKQVFDIASKLCSFCSTLQCISVVHPGASSAIGQVIKAPR